MRKSVSLVTLLGLAFLFIAMAPAAKADGVTATVNGAQTMFTISGTFASNVPTTSFSSPNGAYSLTFTLATSPTPDVVDAADGLFGMTATVSINGVDFASSQVLFFDTNAGNVGGLAVCFSVTCDSASLSTFWDIAGSQLFTGNVNNPTFINGAMTVNGALSGYQINGMPGGDTSFPFPNTTTPTPTPEPASLFLLGIGILGIGAAVRKKLNLG